MKELVVTVNSSFLLLPPNSFSSSSSSSRLLHSTTINGMLRCSSAASSSSSSKLSSTPSSSSSSRPPLLTNFSQDFAPRSANRLKYYAELASKLALDGRFEDFLMIVESVSVSSSDFSIFLACLDIELVSGGIKGLVCDGRMEAVIGIFRKVRGLGISPSALFDESVKDLIGLECRRWAKDGKLKELVDLMEILAGFHLSVKELVDPFEIIKMCAEKCDPDMAVRYIRFLPRSHIWYSSVIQEFGKKGDLLSALVVFEACKCSSSGPNMYACRAIIDVCGLCGDFLKSRKIYEELLNQKVTPNTYVFNSLMNVNAHDLNYSLLIYKNMQNLDVPADMASYNILLKACCLAGRVDLAQDIYNKVKRVASTGAVRLDVIMYSTIIKVFADAKMWLMALKVKEDMLLAGIKPNAITWSSLISACANAGLVEKAVQVFEDMLLAGCKPNTQCCNTLLYACVEACQYDRAFRIFKTWKDNRFRDKFHSKWCVGRDIILNTAQSSSTGIAHLQSSDSVSQFPHLAEVFDFSPTTATYNILMKACGADYYHAKALMDEMKMEGLSPNHISWSILIDICGRSGNVGGAIQSLKNMHDAGIKPDVVAYSTAIKACVDNKSLRLAFNLFEEMKRYRLKPNLVTYNTLLRARTRYGSLHEVQQCLAIYQDMRKAGYRPNDYFLKKLIEEWCEGVIQDNNQNQGIVGQCGFSNKAEMEQPQSLLLEKIAIHLCKDITRSLVIDVRGLTKVEARIVILAVLRMIKENYSTGNPIEDDMAIILGARKEGAGTADHELSEVQNEILKLLQDVLGFTVTLTVPNIPYADTNNTPSPHDLGISRDDREKNGQQYHFKSSTRRPTVLQRLKVTSTSLNRWLQRRLGITVS